MRSFFLFTLFAILFWVSLAKVHKIPLKRRDSLRKQMIRAGKGGEFYEEMEKMRLQRFEVMGNLTAGKKYRQDVYDYADVEYNAIMSMGTPPQECEVVLDTGSSNLWITDKNCEEVKCSIWCQWQTICSYVCNSKCCDDDKNSMSVKTRSLQNVHGDDESPCDNKKLFDSSKSTTYKEDGRKFKIMYGSGNVKGYLGQDTVRFGDPKFEDELVIPNTVFGLANVLSPEFKNFPIDGICGLAFQTIAVDDVVPPINNAIALGLLEQPLFTVWLETEGVTAQHKAGGQFTWGGLDTEHCGAVIDYVKLSAETYWQFTIEGVSVGKRYKSSKKAEVISDTGTSLIGGPKAIVEKIAKSVGATWSKSDGIYEIDCNAKYDPVSFKINGKEYPLKQDVLSIRIEEGSNTCMFALFPFNNMFIGPEWILGDPFIRSYCNIHDIAGGRIGFAPSIQPHA
jgi:hypothetical protein